MRQVKRDKYDHAAIERLFETIFNDKSSPVGMLFSTFVKLFLEPFLFEKKKAGSMYTLNCTSLIIIIIIFFLWGNLMIKKKKKKKKETAQKRNILKKDQSKSFLKHSHECLMLKLIPSHHLQKEFEKKKKAIKEKHSSSSSSVSSVSSVSSASSASSAALVTLISSAANLSLHTNATAIMEKEEKEIQRYQSDLTKAFETSVRRQIYKHVFCESVYDTIFSFFAQLHCDQNNNLQMLMTKFATCKLKDYEVVRSLQVDDDEDPPLLSLQQHIHAMDDNFTDWRKRRHRPNDHDHPHNQRKNPIVINLYCTLFLLTLIKKKKFIYIYIAIGLKKTYTAATTASLPEDTNGMTMLEDNSQREKLQSKEPCNDRVFVFRPESVQNDAKEIASSLGNVISTSTSASTSISASTSVSASGSTPTPIPTSVNSLSSVVISDTRALSHDNAISSAATVAVSNLKSNPILIRSNSAQMPNSLPVLQPCFDHPLDKIVRLMKMKEKLVRCIDNYRYQKQLLAEQGYVNLNLTTTNNDDTDKDVHPKRSAIVLFYKKNIYIYMYMYMYMCFVLNKLTQMKQINLCAIRGADDMICLFAYCLVKSQLSSVYAEIAFIDAFLDEQHSQTEAGFTLS
ncbi:hypothetical protein RFI_08993 [Reticulomyxa filosa]|uniref:Uncharacterized protein n=1 Tax=Reticulomyxa filosa TaxID=46433 RepID=X6NQZ4_RETFI|nr:hypothetical protein RFI_08993 [Reticulomyxa filosa]|eukprot:ETO28139.1 hypothetical protein RFI_08993 [Reticulomyxa filosa]